MSDQNQKQTQDSKKKIAVVYRAGEGDPVTTTWRGKTFVKDKPVEFDMAVENEAGLIEAARANPSFDVDGEDKAKARDEAKNKVAVDAAQVQLDAIKNAGHALEQRQIDEVNAMERRHQQERDDFQNANEKSAIAAHRVIRGNAPNDGTGDNDPVDVDIGLGDGGPGETSDPKESGAPATGAAPPPTTSSAAKSGTAEPVPQSGAKDGSAEDHAGRPSTGGAAPI